MAHAHNCLPSGTIIDRYKVVKPISTGGFSIVYLGVDQTTKQKVVIKEYMPLSQAKRLRNLEIVPISKSKEKIFQKGRLLFFQEASILATLKHANIVNVINFFRAFGTAYMVMEFEQGKNLQTYIQKHKGCLSEKFLLTVFPPLLEGLWEIHESGYLHLDIKPGNIHIRPGGRPLLLDFGSVHRRELSRMHQPAQVATTGYAPIEQYNKTGYVGPWTDIYAIGATMRSCLDGKPPLDAKERYAGQHFDTAITVYNKKYTTELLKAIDWAMEIEPELRPQSVQQLLECLPTMDDEEKPSTPWLARLAGGRTSR
jgi:serine/threonine protein kinase